MFHTHKEAEFSIPTGLAPRGQRAWHWVELSLQCSYFLLTYTQKIDDESSMDRHIFVARVNDAIEMITSSSPPLFVTRLDVMSPGYLRGEDGYRLDKVAEIWRNKNVPRSFQFKLGDGTLIDDIFEPCEDPAMELFLAF